MSNRYSDDRMQSGTGSNITRKKRPMPVDPRRRRPKQEKRRIKMGAVYAIFFMLVAVALVVLSLTVFFKVDSVEVTGETRYNKDEIISLSELRIGENLFLMHIDNEISNRIIAKYPYIESVKIKKKLPATVSIEITEAKPLAVLKGNNGLSLISEKGRVLEAAESSEGYIRLLTDSEADYSVGQFMAVPEDKLSVFREIEENIKEKGIDGISSASILSTSDISLYFGDKIRIYLGATTNIERKLTFTAWWLKDRTESGKIGVAGTFDCSEYPEQTDIRFRPGKPENIP